MKDGRLLRAFHMPSTCQLDGAPGQNWVASHTSFDGGRNDGFVSASGPVAMGYWDETDIPFYYGLAKTFPLCDRYFCSALAQTYPNRRFLIAGTASGVVTTNASNLDKFRPANGTILDRLHAHGISWRDYYTRPARRRGHPEEHEHVRREPLADRAVLQGRGGRHAAGGELRRPALRRRCARQREARLRRVRGGPRRHRLRRELRREGRERDDAEPELEEHRAHLHLRRARRLLRPRPAAARGEARQHPARRGPAGDHRRVRPLRVPRPDGDRLAVREARLRVARRCTTTRRS